MAEPTKTTAKGPTLYALILDTNEVKAVPATELSTLPDPSKVQLYAKEGDATAARDDRVLTKALRDHQIARAKAKVEREREAFAKKYPDEARRFAQQSEAALTAHVAKLEAEGKTAKKKGTGEV